MTKLPHYVLPLYPAIAILTAGAIETKVLSNRTWLKSGTIFWLIGPSLFGIALVALSIIVAHDLALLAWPFLAAAMVFGLFAWRLYEDDGAERSLLRALAASLLMGIATYAVVVPLLVPVFPAVAIARVMRESGCAHPVAASSGFEEPSLVFLAGTDTHLTTPSGAADFLRQGGCRFAFIDARQERAFALRAEAVGLHYGRGPRIDGFNLSNGKPIGIAVFVSAEAP